MLPAITTVTNGGAAILVTWGAGGPALATPRCDQVGAGLSRGGGKCSPGAGDGGLGAALGLGS